MSRPNQYETPEAMQAVIHEYFKGNKTPTITGLARALDLTRQGLINYEGKPEFVDTVRQAKSQVEEILEEGLYGNVGGLMFNLKNNFGWKDKQEVETTGANGGPIHKKVTVEFVNADRGNKDTASKEAGESLND